MNYDRPNANYFQFNIDNSAWDNHFLDDKSIFNSTQNQSACE